MDHMAYITNSTSVSLVNRVEGNPIASYPSLNYPLLELVSSTLVVHQSPWFVLRWTKDKTTLPRFL
jgi:hypothetical protein